MPIERARHHAIFSLGALASVFRRLSLVLLLCAALGILLIQLAKKERIEALRGHVVATLSPVLEVLGLPVEYAHQLAERMQHFLFVYDENLRLRGENARLTSVQEDLRILHAENRYLRKMLKVVPEPVRMFITARVTGDASGPYNHTLIINAGSMHGVVEGMVALSDRGLVGRVVQVEDNTSRILLLTDINSRIPSITEFSRERGIASGVNGELLRLNYLPEDTRVKVGEQVLTSGDGLFFPAGMGVGIVENIVDNEVWIRPYYDKQRLEYITLVKFIAPTPE